MRRAGLLRGDRNVRAGRPGGRERIVYGFGLKKISKRIPKKVCILMS